MYLLSSLILTEDLSLPRLRIKRRVFLVITPRRGDLGPFHLKATLGLITSLLGSERSSVKIKDRSVIVLNK